MASFFRDGVAKIRALRGGQWLGVAVSLLFVAAAVFVLIRDSASLLSASFRLHGGWLFLSFVVECTGLIVAVPVWRQILGRLNGRLSLSKDFRIYCYSMLGVAIPGRLWSVAGRAALYKREGVSGLTVAVASFIELLVFGLAGLVVFGVATAVSPPTNLWQKPMLALVITLLAVVLIQPPLFNRLITWLLRRVRSETDIALSYHDLAIWLVGEVVVVVIGGTAVYILLYSLSPVSLTLLPAIITAWASATIAGSLFFWIPGPVIRDGMMTLVLTQVLPSATAVLFVILVRIWTIASILLLVALIWLISPHLLPKSAKYHS
ncbi:MAG: flippase-like domain-containing protein [Ardenticatenaceae bacterium]|nr:flippase-like domain-containing protein [Ardenticatenaceae bacterium]